MKIVIATTLCATLGGSPALVAAEEPFEPTLKVSGLLVPQYFHEFRQEEESGIGRDSFFLNRARIGVRGEILPKIAYRVTFAIESDLENLADALKEAYVETTYLPNHAIRFGQFKTPFGYEQPESESRLLPINRSLVTNAIGRGEDSRDMGIGIWAGIPIHGGLDAEYAAAAVNGQFLNTRDDLPEKSVFARVGVLDRMALAVLRAGASGSFGSLLDDDGIRTDYRRVGGDVTFDATHAWIAAEAIFDRSEIGDADVDRWGWYVVVAPRWPWRAGVTTAMFRYEVYDPDADASGDRRARLTYGLVHDITPQVRLMGNFEQDASDQPAADRLVFQTLLSF